MHLTFDPPFLPLHTTLLAVVACVVVLGLYVRRELRQVTARGATLLGLRTLLVLALAFILLNPVVVAGKEAPKGRSPFLVLLDTSRSMCTADEGGQMRYVAAKRQTVENSGLMADLAQRYSVRFFQFADKPAAAAPDVLAKLAKPNGDKTSLGNALAGAVSAAGAGGQAGGQILVVSDGRDTGDSFPLDAARAVRSQGYTIHTLCVGRQIKQQDLQVVARKPQVFVSPNQTVQVGAEIRDSGIPRSTVKVDLLKDGKPVATQNVIVEPGRREVSFPVKQPQKGLYRYAINVQTVPEEQNSANNHASVFVNVMNDKARVLFLEGRPSWDSKFLAQALRSDPTITVDVVYKLRDDKFFAVLGGSEKEQGIQIPRTAEQMSRYDVIILGKGFEEFYDEAGAKVLKDWVSERGGNLLFLRGRPDERSRVLREIEPVTWSDRELEELRIRLTQEGKSHPGFAFGMSEDAQTVVKKLPPLISASRVEGEKALTVVLARTENATSDQDSKEMATLAYLRYGQGKVMAIVGQGLWRWAFLPPELEQYGKVYDEFWTQTVRWLVSESDFLPGQNVSVRTDRSSYAPNETVNFLGYLRGVKPTSSPALTLTLPNGKTTTLATAGGGNQADFTATFRPSVPGEYIATVAGSGSKSAPVSCVFTVYAGQEEDLNRSADPDLMRQLAAVGGGQALTANDLSSLPGKLQSAEASLSRKPEQKTAWDKPWVLASLMCLLGLEWYIRRRSGLA
jgi:hypothetical protein